LFQNTKTTPSAQHKRLAQRERRLRADMHFLAWRMDGAEASDNDASVYVALLVVRGAPHCGIVRLVGIPARQQGPTLVQVLRAYDGEGRPARSSPGSLARFRVRPPDAE
jgi:hypothetical protein